jgi:hypothetical protein
MARLSAAEYTAKWQQRLKASTEDIRRGISRVTVSPTESAAKQADLALQKIMAAFQSGKWAAQLRKVTLQDWQNSATNKGLQRIAAGVDGATASQQQMAEKLLAAVDATLAEVNQTPRGDLEQNIGRSATFARGMAKRALKQPAR